MKKIYLGMFSIALFSASIAQEGQSERILKQQKEDFGISTAKPSTPNLQEKATVIWSNDCSNAADWTFTHTTGAGFHSIDWYIETALPTPAGLGDFAATTAANGYLMINSDANNSSDGDGTAIQADATTAVAIDLTAEPDVVLSFEHNFRWWQDKREVRVSGDNGATWTTFLVSDAAGNLVGAQNQNSNNPEVTNFDISAVAGGQAQVLIQFHYDDQDYWAWYWAVDDVKILRKETNDLIITQSWWGSQGIPYFAIPTTQVAPIDFSVYANNFGVADQTGTILTADINGGTFTGTSTPVTIVSGTTDSLFTTTQYTPAATPGTHAITMTVASDFVDGNPLDNVVTDAFEVTTGIYGRDRGVYETRGGGEDGQVPGDFAFEAGNYYDIFFTESFISVDVVVGTGTPVGTIILGKIYMWDGAAWVYVDETAEYTTTAADEANNNNVRMELFTAPTLTAGATYLVVVGCYSEFYYGVSGTSPDSPQTSFISYPTWEGAGSQYYTTRTPMVRLNSNAMPVGIEENVETGLFLGQNMPNPFNNTTTINYTVESNATVTLNIVDMTGKSVMTLNEGTKSAGDYTITLDAAQLSEGMYYYTLSNGETSITKSMTIVK